MTEAPVPAALVFSESLPLLLWSAVPSMWRAAQSERKPRPPPGLAVAGAASFVFCRDRGANREVQVRSGEKAKEDAER